MLKEQASAKLKRADIENEKYELSKPKLHGLLSGMTTREVDDRIVNYRNAKAIAEEQRRAAEDKPGETRARPPDESQCPLALWKVLESGSRLVPAVVVTGPLRTPLAQVKNSSS